MPYLAVFRDQRGSIRGSAFGETPEKAAATIFARFPTCLTVQFCDAYTDGAGRPHGNGCNVRWMSRYEVAK